MLYREQWFLRLSLSIHVYHPLHPSGPLHNILCPYRDVVGKFLLVVQHLLVHVKEYIGEDRSWFCSYISSGVL